MHSPFSSLAWELWRKNRLCWWIVLGLLAAGLLVRLLSPFVPLLRGEAVVAFVVSSATVTFLVIFAIFSCSDSGVQIAYPSRTFTLPASTVVLVHGPILLGALTIGILHTAWMCLVFGPGIADYPLGDFTVFWIGALIAFQAITWCMSNYPKLMAAALVLLASALICLVNLLMTRPRDPWTLACLWGLPAIAYVCAWLAIRQQRRGPWQVSLQAQALVEKAAALFRSKGLFTTPARAQRRMEWRRNAAVPLVVAGLGLALFSVFLIRIANTGDFVPGGISTVWLFFFSSVVTFWATMSGLLLARDPSGKSLSLSPFLAALPISSGELAWAKIKVAFRLTAIGWLIFGLGVFFWWAFIGKGHHRFLREDEAQWIGLVALGLAWCLIGALPCWLAGRIPSAASAGLLLVGGCIFLGNTVAYFSQHYGLVRVLLLYLLGFGFAAKLLLAAWAFRRCYRRRLLRGRAIAIYVAIWMFGTACFLAIAWVACSEAQLPPIYRLFNGVLSPKAPLPRPIALWIAALLFPLARIGLAPLAVAADRHR